MTGQKFRENRVSAQDAPPRRGTSTRLTAMGQIHALRVDQLRRGVKTFQLTLASTSGTAASSTRASESAHLFLAEFVPVKSGLVAFVEIRDTFRLVRRVHPPHAEHRQVGVCAAGALEQAAVCNLRDGPILVREVLLRHGLFAVALVQRGWIRKDVDEVVPAELDDL